MARQPGGRAIHHRGSRYEKGNKKGEGAISSRDQQRINEEIRVPEVRLIGAKGDQVGIVPITEALRIAQEEQTDLVEVAPQADPPVCRLMDYGKFLYEQSKKERESRKSQKQTEIKEIRLRPKTGEHDIAYKVRDARRFLQRGAKVKVRIRFRGREITHPELGRALLNRVAEELSDVGVVEQSGRMEGHTMLMVLGPGKGKTPAGV